jgi:ABC-type transport system involved in multi-copper enzyme maturation permease subunit
MAQIHTEVYRRFQGELRPHPFRLWPLLTSGIRANVRKKLPLLILYAPATIGTIIFSFVVYAGFAAKQGMLSEGMGTGISLQKMMAQQALKLLETRRQIIEFNQAMSVFGLFSVAWYGAGLLCEDRRVGAHQLYFSRPLTRIDYYLGKFLTVGFFAALAMLVPGLVICFVASWSSPDWSFLKEEGDVILRTIGYALIWMTVTCSIVLCSSSLFGRRSFAVAGVVGFTMIFEALAHILAEIVDERILAFSPFVSLEKIAGEVFGQTAHPELEASTSWMVLVGVVLLATLITGWRIRKLEVVA